jgi:hypothetical protein
VYGTICDFVPCENSLKLKMLYVHLTLIYSVTHFVNVQCTLFPCLKFPECVETVLNFFFYVCLVSSFGDSRGGAGSRVPWA